MRRQHIAHIANLDNTSVTVSTLEVVLVSTVCSFSPAVRFLATAFGELLLPIVGGITLLFSARFGSATDFSAQAQLFLRRGQIRTGSSVQRPLACGGSISPTSLIGQQVCYSFHLGSCARLDRLLLQSCCSLLGDCFRRASASHRWWYYAAVFCPLRIGDGLLRASAALPASRADKDRFLRAAAIGMRRQHIAHIANLDNTSVTVSTLEVVLVSTVCSFSPAVRFLATAFGELLLPIVGGITLLFSARFGSATDFSAQAQLFLRRGQIRTGSSVQRPLACGGSISPTSLIGQQSCCSLLGDCFRRASASHRWWYYAAVFCPLRIGDGLLRASAALPASRADKDRFLRAAAIGMRRQHIAHIANLDNTSVTVSTLEVVLVSTVCSFSPAVRFLATAFGELLLPIVGGITLLFSARFGSATDFSAQAQLFLRRGQIRTGSSVQRPLACGGSISPTSLIGQQVCYSFHLGSCARLDRLLLQSCCSLLGDCFRRASASHRWWYYAAVFCPLRIGDGLLRASAALPASRADKDRFLRAAAIGMRRQHIAHIANLDNTSVTVSTLEVVLVSTVCSFSPAVRFLATAFGELLLPIVGGITLLFSVRFGSATDFSAQAQLFLRRGQIRTVSTLEVVLVSTVCSFSPAVRFLATAFGELLLPIVGGITLLFSVRFGSATDFSAQAQLFLRRGQIRTVSTLEVVLVSTVCSFSPAVRFLATAFGELLLPIVGGITLLFSVRFGSATDFSAQAQLFLRRGQIRTGSSVQRPLACGGSISPTSLIGQQSCCSLLGDCFRRASASHRWWYYAAVFCPLRIGDGLLRASAALPASRADKDRFLRAAAIGMRRQHIAHIANLDNTSVTVSTLEVVLVSTVCSFSPAVRFLATAFGELLLPIVGGITLLFSARFGSATDFSAQAQLFLRRGQIRTGSSVQRPLACGGSISPTSLIGQQSCCSLLGDCFRRASASHRWWYYAAVFCPLRIGDGLLRASAALPASRADKDRFLRAAAIGMRRQHIAHIANLDNTSVTVSTLEVVLVSTVCSFSPAVRFLATAFGELLLPIVGGITLLFSVRFGSATDFSAQAQLFLRRGQIRTGSSVQRPLACGGSISPTSLIGQQVCYSFHLGSCARLDRLLLQSCCSLLGDCFRRASASHRWWYYAAVFCPLRIGDGLLRASAALPASRADKDRFLRAAAIGMRRQHIAHIANLDNTSVTVSTLEVVLVSTVCSFSPAVRFLATAFGELLLPIVGGITLLFSARFGSATDFSAQAQLFLRRGQIRTVSTLEVVLVSTVCSFSPAVRFLATAFGELLLPIVGGITLLFSVRFGSATDFSAQAQLFLRRGQIRTVSTLEVVLVSTVCSFSPAVRFLATAFGELLLPIVGGITLLFSVRFGSATDFSAQAQLFLRRGQIRTGSSVQRPLACGGSISPTSLIGQQVCYSFHLGSCARLDRLLLQSCCSLLGDCFRRASASHRWWYYAAVFCRFGSATDFSAQAQLFLRRGQIRTGSSVQRPLACGGSISPTSLIGQQVCYSFHLGSCARLDRLLLQSCCSLLGDCFRRASASHRWWYYAAVFCPLRIGDGLLRASAALPASRADKDRFLRAAAIGMRRQHIAHIANLDNTSVTVSTLEVVLVSTVCSFSPAVRFLATAFGELLLPIVGGITLLFSVRFGSATDFSAQAQLFLRRGQIRTGSSVQRPLACGGSISPTSLIGQQVCYSFHLGSCARLDRLLLQSCCSLLGDCFRRASASHRWWYYAAVFCPLRIGDGLLRASAALPASRADKDRFLRAAAIGMRRQHIAHIANLDNTSVTVSTLEVVLVSTVCSFSPAVRFLATAFGELLLPIVGGITLLFSAPLRIGDGLLRASAALPASRADKDRFLRAAAIGMRRQHIAHIANWTTGLLQFPPWKLCSSRPSAPSVLLFASWRLLSASFCFPSLVVLRCCFLSASDRRRTSPRKRSSSCVEGR
ncbi:hypothetical protein ISCGN_007496 [Ixodes scapularis]